MIDFDRRSRELKQKLEAAQANLRSGELKQQLEAAQVNLMKLQDQLSRSMG